MANKRKNDNYVTDKTLVAKQQAQKAAASKKAKAVTKQVLIITAAVLVIAAIITGFVFAVWGCTKRKNMSWQDPATAGFEVTHTVQIKIKGYDNVIEIDLYGKEAPKTVAFLAEALKSYEGSQMYLYTDKKTTGDEDNVSDRVSFSPNIDADLSYDYYHTIKGEFFANGSNTTNNVSHVAGVLTMDKAGLALSYGYFFSILTEEDFDRDGNYAAVGYVKDKEDLEFLKKLIAEYKQDADKDTSTTVNTVLSFIATNKITITKEDAESADKTIDRTFTPKSTGKYTIKGAEGGFKTLSVKLGDDVVGSFDTPTLKAGAEIELVADREYTFTFGFDEKDADKTFEIAITGEVLLVGDNKVTFPKLESSSTGTDSGASSQADEDTKVSLTYTFTAPSTSKYSFTSTDVKFTIKKKGADEALKTNVDVTLYAGETYEINMEVSSDKAGKTQTINVKEKTLYLGTNSVKYEIADLKGDTDSYLEFVFAAEESGTHIFELLTHENKTISGSKNVEIYKGDTLVGEKAATLVKNEVYTVRVYDKGLTASKEYHVKATQTIAVGNNSVIIKSNATKNDTVYLFTPSITGIYTFYTTTEGVYLKSEVREVGSDKVLGLDESLEAGKTYEVKLISVKANTEEVEDLEKDTAAVVTVQGTSVAEGTNNVRLPKGVKEYTFDFKATTAGIYSFVAINTNAGTDEKEENEDEKPVIELLDKDGNVIEVEDLENVVLEKNGEYKIKVSRTVYATDIIYKLTISKNYPVIDSVEIIEK